MKDKTKSSRFSRQMQECGLYRAGLGIDAIVEMRLLQMRPEPLLPRVKKGGGVTSTMGSLGQMIRHGFAELRLSEKKYYLLPAGTEWLAQIDDRLSETTPKQ